MIRKSFFRFWWILLVAVPSASWGDCSDPAAFCVGLVTDVGSIDDRSFNQSAWEGVLKAREEMKAEVKYIETRDAKDYRTNIELFAESGYDVVVTVGFGLGEATLHAAKKYPNIDFIGVDQFQAKPSANVAGLVFHEDRAGFLAGSLAALLTRSGIIAAVLGTDMVPPIVAFRKGYEAGARYVRPDVRIIATYHPGGLDVAFTDPEWGATTAKQAIDQGADVVFSAGGTTGNGGLIEVAAHPGTYCIGVDTDQWATLPKARPCLVSCAMKHIDAGVTDLIRMAKAGRFPPGNFFGDVGLSPFHDFDKKIPEEVKEKIRSIGAGLRNGEINPSP